MLLSKYFLMLCTSIMPLILSGMNQNTIKKTHNNTNQITPQSSLDQTSTFLIDFLLAPCAPQDNIPHLLDYHHCKITKKNSTPGTFHIDLYARNQSSPRNTPKDSTSLPLKRKSNNNTVLIPYNPNAIPTKNTQHYRNLFIDHINNRNFPKARAILINNVNNDMYIPFVMARYVFNGEARHHFPLQNAQQWYNCRTLDLDKRSFFKFLLDLSTHQFNNSKTLSRSALFVHQYNHLTTLPEIHTKTYSQAALTASEKNNDKNKKLTSSLIIT
jgi:hypothetical protein